MQFDCIIPAAGKDCLLIRKNLPLIIKNINPEKIYILTKSRFFIYFKGLNDQIKKRTILIDEDKLLPNITYSTIKEYIVNIGYPPKSTGWYYQQFLKMGFALSEFSEAYYLSWDADTIPINNICFFEGETPLFTMKEEYHEPYFYTIKKLLNLEKSKKSSFISENMMFNSEVMRDLIKTIDQSAVKGNTWCEKIINAMPLNKNNSFSEFETYGTFVLSKYPNMYKFRELRTYRRGGEIITRLYNQNTLNKFANQYDMISLEQSDHPKGFLGYISFIQKAVIYSFNKILDFIEESKNKK